MNPPGGPLSTGRSASFYNFDLFLCHNIRPTKIHSTIYLIESVKLK